MACFGIFEEHIYVPNTVFLWAFARDFALPKYRCPCYDHLDSDDDDDSSTKDFKLTAAQYCECTCSPKRQQRMKDPWINCIRVIVRVVAPDDYLVSMPEASTFHISVWEGSSPTSDRLDTEIMDQETAKVFLVGGNMSRQEYETACTFKKQYGINLFSDDYCPTADESSSHTTRHISGPADCIYYKRALDIIWKTIPCA